MTVSVWALAALVSPVVSVRITEPVSDLDGAAQPESSLAAHKQEIIPGIPNTPDCCCYATPCSWQDEVEYQAKPLLLNNSRFVPHTTGMVDSCCKNFTKLQFGACSNGQTLSFVDCLHTDFAWTASSVDSCAEKVAWFFRRDDWYKYLPDYDQHGWFSSVKRSYQEYVPCLNSKQAHVSDVVLNKLSFFKSKTWGNPIRHWVMSRHECSELSQEEVQYAVEKSFDQLCKFPMKHSYQPNFQPEQACAYNLTNELIHMSTAQSCPEGHRCACPVNGKQLAARPEKQGWLHKLTSGETYVKALTGITQIGILATLGLAAGWTLPVTAPGAVLLVYGYKAASSRLFFNCQAAVGCYPMDCVHEEGVGCRIGLPIDESDPRNPYWFMPPPMYKCGANRWGKCHLAACSAEDARHQRVGEGSMEYGFWKKKPISIVHNCQPLLAADMNSQEGGTFETMVGSLRSKEHEQMRRTSILVGEMQKLCPFLRPSEHSRSARCQDGYTCDVTGIDDPATQNCCSTHGGIKQCPAKYPKLCMDGWCDHEINNCRDRAGLQKCPAENECEFLLPTAENDLVECNDGETAPTSEFKDVAWCSGKRGLKKCPWNKPNMCENTEECNGEHCCAKDCTTLGGPRRCGSMQQAHGQIDARGARSGAPGVHRLSACAFLVLAVVLRLG